MHNRFLQSPSIPMCVDLFIFCLFLILVLILRQYCSSSRFGSTVSVRCTAVPTLCAPLPDVAVSPVVYPAAATVVTGAYRLAEKANKRPAITDEQAVKFANYLANRKAIQSVKGAYHLANGLTMFCTNKVSRCRR